MKILFYDPVCNKPYDLAVLQDEALGGTEATVVRVAEGLHAKGHVVVVEQHCRESPSVNNGPAYVPVNHGIGLDHVICLRIPGELYQLRKRFPKARLWLWMHDMCDRDVALAVPLIEAVGANIICVSETHKSQVVDMLKVGGYDGQFRVNVIHNPIDNDLRPDGTPVDKNKLVFFSSPHKGLQNALDIFHNLLSFHLDFRLYVSNPGYAPTDTEGLKHHPNVIDLGTISHKAAIEHVRSALCVFYPNVVFPETFGLVFAEANAVGTPVVTHPFGAATEILDRYDCETVDCRDPKQVIDRVLSWHSGSRPVVRGRVSFRLNAVVKRWINLLDP